MLPMDVLPAYLVACIVMLLVPGPAVTVIIANSLRHGAHAGLLNIAGIQLGLAVMLAILAIGLSTIIHAMSWAFDVLRMIGAAYLVWLGFKLWRGSAPTASTGASASEKQSSYFWQGLLVIWSNPKALLFFGAFIPQFVDPAGPAALQTVALGLIFMVAAAITDGAYALAAGRAGRWLSGDRLRLMERISGSFLVGGGLWLALTRRSV